MTIYILLIITIILSLTVVILLNYIRKTKYEINKIVTILEDIDSGNIHRRIITNNNLLTTNLCYTINSIINKHENQLIKLKQSELSYRKLITSLSHDIKTPLASLVGYLDAINNKIVQDNEKDFYIQVALKKSLNLTTYINTLFEWLKLESGERIYNFKKVELCELTHNIITEWIPELEKNKFTYNIDIPENKLLYSKIDISSYKRIINNLIHNCIVHSKGSIFNLIISYTSEYITISISDNGIGISENDIPYIFDRLYKCNNSRGTTGNGLGLSIVKELVKALKGKVSVESSINNGTTFKVTLSLHN